MRFSWLIVLYFLFPLAALAQSGEITGKVSRADTKAPLGEANVFLSNSTAGTSTNDIGDFRLNGLKPGQYTLVVSLIGYEDYTQNVLVGREPIKLNIALSPRINELHEVIISTPADWKKNYAQFVRDFIGTDDNAKYCTVINPHEVSLEYHRAKQTLEAFTDDFLVVENLALGYRVKFLIKSFNSSKLTGIISYDGQRLFQELPGSKKQKEEWHKKRAEAYYGSPMHFYRSLYTNKLDSDGFIIMKYTRLLNPNRPQEEIIQQKLKRFNDGKSRDSLNYWISMQNMSKYYREDLDEHPIPTNEVLYRTDQTGVYAVGFKRLPPLCDVHQKTGRNRF